MKSKLSIVSAWDNGKLTHTVICEGIVTKPKVFAGFTIGSNSQLVQLPVKTYESELVVAFDGTVYDSGLAEAKELIDKFNE